MAGIAPCRLVVMLAALLAKARMPSSLSTVRVSSVLLAELGQGRPEEGIACAVGVAHLAGNARHMTSLVPKAVEHAVCTQGDENQPDAVLGQLGRAAFAVGGAGEQGQLLIGNFQNIHQRQGCFHLGNGILFVPPEVGTVIGVISNDSTQLFGAGGSVQRGGAGGVGGQADRAEVDDFGGFQSLVRDVLLAQHHVSVGTAVEAEIPLTGGIHRHDCHGGGVVCIHRHAGNVHLVLCQNLFQVAAKGIRTHLADKGGLCAQSGCSHSQIGRGTAGICCELRDAAFILAGLGQVDQNFTNR